MLDLEQAAVNDSEKGFNSSNITEHYVQSSWDFVKIETIVLEIRHYNLLEWI